MSVYSQALEEIAISGAITLPAGRCTSTYRIYARKINELLAQEGADWRVTAHPKQRIIEKIKEGDNHETY